MKEMLCTVNFTEISENGCEIILIFGVVFRREYTHNFINQKFYCRVVRNIHCNHNTNITCKRMREKERENEKVSANERERERERERMRE
jgi:hypothetical protein